VSGLAGESGSHAGDAGYGWLSVRVHPGANREGVVAALFSVGAQGVQELGDDFLTMLAGDVPADVVAGAVLAASPDARVETAPADAVDWSVQWKRTLRAQELGALVIAPPWLADAFDPARTVVVDPGMAFGTGEHPTTRGVVRLLPSVVRAGDRVADLGAGSAVLAIAAVKLGAARAIAIEIDADAIGNAEENVARNGVADRVTVLEGDAEELLPLVAPVRVVLANIVSTVLVSLLPAIGAALTDDGEAILSGILASERTEMRTVLESSGWAVTAEDHEDVWWSAVIARR
jgi:ribosomal protein L11 methyltransferase